MLGTMYVPISVLIPSESFVWDFDRFYKHYKEIRGYPESLGSQCGHIVSNIAVDDLTEKNLCQMLLHGMYDERIYRDLEDPHRRLIQQYNILTRDCLENHLVTIHNCPRDPLRGSLWFKDHNIWYPTANQNMMSLPITDIPTMLKYIDMVDAWSKEPSLLLLGLRLNRTTILSRQDRSVVRIIARYVLAGSREIAWTRLRDHLSIEKNGGHEKFLEWKHLANMKFQIENRGQKWTQIMEDNARTIFRNEQESKRIAREEARIKAKAEEEKARATETLDRRVNELTDCVSGIFDVMFPFVEELLYKDKILALYLRDVVVQFVLACRTGNIELVKTSAKDIDLYYRALVTTENSELGNFKHHNSALFTMSAMLEIAKHEQLIRKISDKFTCAIAKRFPQILH